MPFKIFVVPIRNIEEGERELNAFVRGHKVLAVDRHWVEEGSTSFWTFCVDYLDGAAGGSGGGAGTNGRPPGVRDKVDYKLTLKPEDFAIYARLRDLRKAIATADGVPVYTIFTNEQLAHMVEQRVTSKTALEKIVGVGNGRVEKYGARMLEVLGAAFEVSDEAKQATV